MVLVPIPAFLKKSAESLWGAMKEILSPDCIRKFPSGITTMSPRSTAQMSTLLLSFSTTSDTRIWSRADSLGITNFKSSTRPLAKGSILMADGNLKSLAISIAAALSGLMAMERFSSPLM